MPTLSTDYSVEGAATKLPLTSSNGVAITDAVLATSKVITADVRADNGVIHAVDKVLVPPGGSNVVQMAQANPATFSSLVGTVVATGPGQPFPPRPSPSTAT